MESKSSLQQFIGFDFSPLFAKLEGMEKLLATKTTEPIREVFDKQQAADFLGGISVKKLEGLIKEGLIVCSMDVGNTYLLREDLLKYVRDNRVDKKAIGKRLQERAAQRRKS